MALWTPDLLPSIDAWYKGDSLAGAGGSNITSWTDSTGHGHHATPPATAPTVVAAGLNGINVAGFTVAGQQSLNSTLTNTGTYTLFTLARFTVTPFGGGGRIIASTNAVSNNFICGWEQTGIDCAYNNGGIKYPGTSTYPLTFLSYCLVGNAGTNQTFYGDGTSLASNANAAAPLGLNGALNFGSDYNGQWSDCEIAEVIHFTSALGTTDRQLVEGYMAWHWGRQASLPGGHPYAGAAPTTADAPPARDTHTAIPFTQGAGGGGLRGGPH